MNICRYSIFPILRNKPIASYKRLSLRKNFPQIPRIMSQGINTLHTDDAMFPAGPYSQGVATPSTIYCSGQIPALPSGELVTGSIGEKTAACIKGLQAVLKAGGSNLEKVVKVNVFLTDMKNFAEMNEEYAKWFTTKPARSCVAVYQLPKGVEVEIECIAMP